MPEANVIPVIRRLFSGTETPLGLYEKLCGKRPNTFLLESAEQGVWGRFSFVGVQSRGQLVAEDSGVTWVSEHPALPNSQSLPSDPVEALETLQQAWVSESADFPLSSGLVGFAGWGLTELIEDLPPKKSEDYKLPLFGFNQFSELVVLDHQRSELILVSVVFLDGQSTKEQKFESANRELDRLEEKIAQPTRARLSEPKWPEPKYSMRSTKGEFLTAVETAKHHVRLGDVFQVVISQRFDQQVTADALDVYSSLRAINPSPYMYLTRWEDEQGEFAIVGSSPEALIKVSGENVITHPIAGSRPRGKDQAQDGQLAQDLLADAKERSEHLMLVDLARNDLLKVCEPASLSVSEFMEIHRFSHIMHLVSTVEGKLRKDTSLVRSLLATFPAGTLSGAPKPRALEIIHDLEPTARGLFGGVVGYFDFQGNADLAIAIRTALIRDGVARIQAGAGIVLDSDPESEYQETLSKAAVVLRAVASANEMTK
jgi:anthranilate synthase component I